MSPHLQTHVGITPGEVRGDTVREALESLFTEHPRLRSYLLDDRGAVRKHVAVFVNGESVKDRATLSDPLPPDGEIFLMQALSGG
ncbi:hypothetical protein Hhel01_04012 [Haloferula helveola]